MKKFMFEDLLLSFVQDFSFLCQLQFFGYGLVSPDISLKAFFGRLRLPESRYQCSLTVTLLKRLQRIQEAEDPGLTKPENVSKAL